MESKTGRAKAKRMVALRPGDAVEAAAPHEKLLLTLEETARALDIGVDAVKALIADGTLYAIRIGTSGRYQRVPLAEVEKFRSGSYAYQRPLPQVPG